MSLSSVSISRRLVVAMAMNLVIPAVQIVAGVIAGSVALISDALHNLGDFTATLIGYIAHRVGEKPSTPKLTFGYRRVEVLAAILNTVLLYGACLYIALEAWDRLQDPRPVRGTIVAAAAFLGFAANMVSVAILHPGARSSLNIRSVFLHMMADAMTSLALAALGVLWIFKPWYRLDPLVSWVIVIIILYNGWGILKEAVQVLMNAVPPGLDIGEIRETILHAGPVDDVHHIHVWPISEDEIALAAHVVVSDRMLSDVDRLAESIRESLFRRHGIVHPTLQFETRRFEPARWLSGGVARNGDDPGEGGHEG